MKLGYEKKYVVRYLAFIFLINVTTNKISRAQNQITDHSGSCRPKIAGNFAEQIPSALNSQGKCCAN